MYAPTGGIGEKAEPSFSELAFLVYQYKHSLN